MPTANTKNQDKKEITLPGNTYDLEMLFWEEAEKGNLLVVQTAIAKCKTKISQDIKGFALTQSANKGHLLVVQEILKECFHEISAKDKGRALAIASAHGHLLIVKEIMQQCGHQIDSSLINKALENAQNKKEIFDFLTEHTSFINKIQVLGLFATIHHYVMRTKNQFLPTTHDSKIIASKQPDKEPSLPLKADKTLILSDTLRKQNEPEKCCSKRNSRRQGARMNVVSSKPR